MSEIDKDPLWYKDAIIYQLHVKAFADSNNDGIGDFPGLTAKLDYLQELGVNTLWLLPFYPSPMRDDGYDIADYRNVNPAYGTLGDFKRFVKEAHKRGLRVITELVINHTSDQHPWFQRARKAKAGSSHRDFYVWSDTDQKYLETRIIFSDTETSNWAWDPEANAFYWHRFFSHQPDLNFDNPRVLEEVIKVMYFWLDMGVDGLRLDAVPYLVERDGTSNENLPETHIVIKKIRTALDARYPDRLLLAEANQWPEDVLAYFGEGDECHMAFHFPLMPRMYMAIAQADRHPVTDIMNQTPDIPENCQWATFLRNHDELTLEMVTDRERDYLWNYYAADRRARINFGIRRRLAPLMENDRRKIELLDSLLMSMPGTPVVYYGDEIGMGDNIFLGDRNGVRTPMQWSPDRNGGFSQADPASLYLPAIMDPIYGYQALNVEAQRRVQNSLLNWTRRLIHVAAPRKAFSRGTLRFFLPANRKVLAYIREHEGEQILCVANLSHSPQPCELDLREFNGKRPLELLGHSPFPRIGELPYFLTLPAYGFYWFLLTEEGEEPGEEVDVALPELHTLVMPKGWESLMGSRSGDFLEKQILPLYLSIQRWYRAKCDTLPTARLVRIFPVKDSLGLALIEVTAEGQEPQLYVMGLGIAWEEGHDDPAHRLQKCMLARVRQGARVGVLYDASRSEDLIHILLSHLQEETEIVSGELRLACRKYQPLDGLNIGGETKSLGDYSNTSIRVNGSLICKIIRQPHIGPNLEEEIGHYLTEVAGFTNTPPLLGSIVVEGFEGGGSATVVLLNRLIKNQGDGWQFTQEYLERYIEEIRLLTPEEIEGRGPQHEYYIRLAETLGQRTGEMHRAFAQQSGKPDFEPQPIDLKDRRRLIEGLHTNAEKAFDLIEHGKEHLPEEVREMVERLLSYRGRCHEVIRNFLPPRLKTVKTRLHGDYHLGQVLVHENDFYLIDFEGEPARSPQERRAKNSPLKDVAGMLRSFDYAACGSLNHAEGAFGENVSHLWPAIRQWREDVSTAFLRGYDDAAPDCLKREAEETQALIDFFLLDKAVYEIIYEVQNRPNYLKIPVDGLLRLLERRGL